MIQIGSKYDVLRELRRVDELVWNPFFEVEIE